MRAPTWRARLSSRATKTPEYKYGINDYARPNISTPSTGITHTSHSVTPREMIKSTREEVKLPAPASSGTGCFYATAKNVDELPDAAERRRDKLSTGCSQYALRSDNTPAGSGKVHATVYESHQPSRQRSQRDGSWKAITLAYGVPLCLSNPQSSIRYGQTSHRPTHKA